MSYVLKGNNEGGECDMRKLDVILVIGLILSLAANVSNVTSIQRIHRTIDKQVTNSGEMIKLVSLIVDEIKIMKALRR